MWRRRLKTRWDGWREQRSSAALQALTALAAVTTGRAVAVRTAECLGARVHTSDHSEGETGLLDEGERTRTNRGNQGYNGVGDADNGRDRHLSDWESVALRQNMVPKDDRGELSSGNMRTQSAM